jgi:ubiquitin carboxyl-terminal hydrolase 5/13
LQVRLAVDKVLLAESADRKEQLAAWVADKKNISAYAMDLQQLDNGVIVPPTGWKCSKCDKTENLWLNLTDGMILCGRKLWDGSGGNNHAIEHYEQTKYPLAVKLGTITADLEAAGNCTLNFYNLFSCFFGSDIPGNEILSPFYVSNLYCDFY